MKTATAQSWAREEFGQVFLGDVRRTRRLVAMAAGAARNPSGKVSAVFDKAKEREGAYDFLESREASAKAVAEGVFATTAERAKKWPYVYVVIDGWSLSLPDETGRKGFGPVGSRRIPVSGVMGLTSSLAIAGDGTPLGLIDQISGAAREHCPSRSRRSGSATGAPLRGQGAGSLRSRCGARD